jgi:hypothetical protein
VRGLRADAPTLAGGVEADVSARVDKDWVDRAFEFLERDLGPSDLTALLELQEQAGKALVALGASPYGPHADEDDDYLLD